jgi:hypothetical protein
MARCRADSSTLQHVPVLIDMPRQAPGLLAGGLADPHDACALAEASRDPNLQFWARTLSRWTPFRVGAIQAGDLSPDGGIANAQLQSQRGVAQPIRIDR